MPSRHKESMLDDTLAASLAGVITFRRSHQVYRGPAFHSALLVHVCLNHLPCRLLYCFMSLVCLIIGASSTHGLGGYLQWGRPPACYMENVGEHKQGAQPSRSGLGNPSGGSAGVSFLEHSGSEGGIDESCGDVGVARSVDAPGARSPPQRDAMGEADRPARAGESEAATASTAASDAAVAALVDEEGAGRGSVEGGGTAWAFFQPFAGGTVFVVTQVGRAQEASHRVLAIKIGLIALVASWPCCRSKQREPA
jgi:hypothetical protein